MMVSRRTALVGAAALATTAGLARWRGTESSAPILLFDESLSAGRQFAAAGRAISAETISISGDPVRLALKTLAPEPPMIVGVSRPSDALIIQDVAGEAGYSNEAEYAASAGGCSVSSCALNRAQHVQNVHEAGTDWPTALANWAAGERFFLPSILNREPVDSGLVLGWVLVRRRGRPTLSRQ